MENLLDAYFPRPQRAVTPPPPAESDPGVIPGVPQKSKKSKGGKRKTPRNINRVSEALVHYIFTKTLDAAISKSQVQEVMTPGGVFSRSTDVDYVGSMPIVHSGRAVSYSIKIEVKGVTGRGFALSGISDNERGYLDAGRAAGQGCLLALVVWPGDVTDIQRGNVEAVYLVPWQKWLQIETALELRAKGNFKGKSLRREDFDLLDGCAVVKKSNRWSLEDGHWLTPLLPARTETANLF